MSKYKQIIQQKLKMSENHPCDRFVPLQNTALLYIDTAKKLYITRIEPVGEPYREVCLYTELWPETVHQPNCWLKHPGTWLEHVLAYCCNGKKYVGCIELLFNYIVQLADSSTDGIFSFVWLWP